MAGLTDLTGEVQTALKLAREMSVQGKSERALKILRHALSLYPKNPDVLNAYGEHLEQKNDVTLADYMYGRALAVCPRHDKATENQQRTLPLVKEIDQTRLDGISRKQDLLSSIPDTHPGLRRMVQENRIRQIHHTTAMEGNTFSLLQTRCFVETHIVVPGKSIVEHNEILGMEAAYDNVNSSLVKRSGALTTHDVLEIHRRVLGFVDPFGAGVLRTTQA